MPLKTLDIYSLAAKTGNLYETVVIISKRARQISSTVKSELDEKLQYFEGFEADLDDTRLNEEQSRISKEYEVRPKPGEQSIEEMLEDEIYYRRPGDDVPPLV